MTAPSFLRPTDSSFRWCSSLSGALTLTLAIAAPVRAQFAPSLPFIAGTNAPRAIAVGKLNAPPNREIVSAHAAGPFLPSGADEWSIPPTSFGQSPCSLPPPTPVALGFPGASAASFTLPGLPSALAWDVAIADINTAIGCPFEETCVLVVDPFQSYVEVSCTAVIPFPPLVTPMQLIAADFNGNNEVDLLALDSTGQLWLSSNVANVLGPFIPLGQPAPRPSPLRMALGSFNNDNFPDVVITWGGLAPAVTVWTNLLFGTSVGAPTATTLLSVAPLAHPGCLAVDDFNGDGVDDYVVLDGQLWPLPAGNNRGWVFLSNRTLLPAIAFPAAPIPSSTMTPVGAASFWPTAVTSGDYDCDGDVDLAYTSTDGFLYIRPNANNGTFPNVSPHLEVSYASGGSNISDMETDDVDYDGDLDIAVCNSASGPAGWVKLWCNQMPWGECRHYFRAGHGGLDIGIAPFECACPSAALVTHFTPPLVRNFDTILPALSNFAHTFANLPPKIRSAKLKVSKPPNGVLKLDLGAPFGQFSLDYTELRAGIPAAPVVLDLANLPGGQNLLPRLEKVRRLDVAAGPGTRVDYLELEIVACCDDSYPDLVYSHTSIDATGIPPITFTVSGNAVLYANSPAFIAFGANVGCPHFGPPFDNLCLLPSYPIVLSLLLNGSGVGTTTVATPAVACCLDVHSQAFAIPLISVGPFNFGASNTVSDYTK